MGNILKFSEEQLQLIQLGKESNINYTLYLDKKYKPDQMEQIYLGLIAGIDASIYASPTIRCVDMEKLRYALIDEMQVGKYYRIGFSSWQLDLLLFQLKHKREVRYMDKIYIPSLARLIYMFYINDILIPKQVLNCNRLDVNIAPVLTVLGMYRRDITAYLDMQISIEEQHLFLEIIDKGYYIKDIMDIKDSAVRKEMCYKRLRLRK